MTINVDIQHIVTMIDVMELRLLGFTYYFSILSNNWDKNKLSKMKVTLFFSRKVMIKTNFF